MVRASVIKSVCDGKTSTEEAALQLKLSTRQIARLKKSFIANGVRAFEHKNTARKPSNSTTEETKNKILEVFLDWKRKTDDGLNASHLADVLKRDHGIKVSRTTTWRILKSTSLFTDTRRMRKHRTARERRGQEGDILYLDGSPHHWFGQNYPKATLLLCTDDATSKALWATFVKEENRNGCFEVAHEVFSRYGLPKSFWLDRASQFVTTRGNGQVRKQSELATHWQDSMYKLGIRLIFANSAQARGRGERANGTFQDRLATELQFHNIRDMKLATKYMNEIFIPDYNKRFSVEAKQAPAWRVIPNNFDLRQILSAIDERLVLNDNSIKHNGIRYQIQKMSHTRGFQRDRIEVQEWFDGSIHLIHPKFGELKYEAFREPRKDNQLYHLTKSLKQRPDIFPAT